jgi:aminoglycoside phosphotransferase (APT) family kinase protein
VLRLVGATQPRSEVKMRITPPWSAECVVDERLARCLVETQFPSLAPVRLKSLGAGWDNTAYLVNDALVFRFPRRQIAVELLETEFQLLPKIAPRLPVQVPVPKFQGQPAQDYPWVFSGYQFLPGRTADAAAFDEGDRLLAAEPIARFLAALHSIQAEEAIRWGARPDSLARLDVSHRAPLLRQRLEGIVGLGLVDNEKALLEVIELAVGGRSSKTTTIVHGDLYTRHLLVDENKQLSGVIDWGDLHLGDPAIDLSIAYGFLPPSAREIFQRAYGPIDDGTWRLARFKALQTAVAVVAYGHDVADADLLREGQIALRYIASR